MTTKTKMARHGCRHDAPCLPIAKSSKTIVPDYHRGARYAAWLFVAMFAVLSFGTVFLGW